MVLDTWFTSGISIDINNELLKNKYESIHPSEGGQGGSIPHFDHFTLRPQAHDIIRTRLLYTTLHTYLREKRAPFKNIMMSGYVLASKNEKISKSANNAKTGPEQLIEQR